MVELRAQVGTNTWTNGRSADYKSSVCGLDVGNHGGYCCGMRHLFNFPLQTEPNEFSQEEKTIWLAEAIERCISSFENDDNSGELDDWRCCIEVTLAEYQLTEWCRTLEEAGFKQVYSFLNSNSGNECHVFLLETNRPR